LLASSAQATKECDDDVGVQEAEKQYNEVKDKPKDDDELQDKKNQGNKQYLEAVFTHTKQLCDQRVIIDQCKALGEGASKIILKKMLSEHGEYEAQTLQIEPQLYTVASSGTALSESKLEKVNEAKNKMKSIVDTFIT